MLDLSTVLDVATTVIRVIDLGSWLVSAGQEIYNPTSEVSNGELESTTEDLRCLSRALMSSLRSISQVTSLSEDEKKLTDIALETKNIAIELISLLEKVEMPSRNEVGATSSVCNGFVNMSNDISMNKMKARLDYFRTELVLHIVVSLKQNKKMKCARIDDRFKSMEEKSKNIAEGILDNRSFFVTSNQEIKESLLGDAGKESNTDHGFHEEPFTEIIDMQSLALDACHLTQNSGAFYSCENDRGEFSCSELEELQTQILQHLWFRDLYSRFDDVPPAYPNTFPWLYHGKSQNPSGWASFMEWLSEPGGGSYWINGKAGSGKSTLMKYIANEPATHKLLTKWASDDVVIVSSFFFWSAGSILQKSQAGLLRAMLFDTLSKYPGLIPVVFPDKFGLLSHIEQDTLGPPLSELKKAFSLLTTQKIAQIKMCFFIDGIDEYEGNHFELAQYIRSLSSDRIKLVLSSRPTPACVTLFSDCPSLELHKLTRQDLTTYVQGNIVKHPQMRELLRTKQSELEKIITQIVKKASGVFLWVVLVTRSLLTSSTNFDDINALHRTLNDVPDDIDQLYMHMLSRMELRHQQQASRLLQIVYQNSQLPNSQEITLLRLSYADEANPATAIDVQIGMMDPIEAVSRCHEIEDRIRSHCCGLIETYVPKHQLGNRKSDDNETRLFIDFLDLSSPPSLKSNHGNSKQLIQSEVHFLHRSVIEFLQKPEIWAGLRQLTMGTSFDPGVALASSSLLMMKNILPELDSYADRLHIMKTLQRGLEECSMAEESTGNSQDYLFEEFDSTMTLLWRLVFHEAGPWPHFFQSSFNWIGWRQEAPCYDSIISIACRYGLKLYIKNLLDRYGCPMLSFQVIPGIQFSVAQTALNRVICIMEIMRTPHPYEQMLLFNQLDIILISLEYGADPNVKFYKCHTPWLVALWRCKATDFYCVKLWTEVLEMFILAGADPNAEYLSNVEIVGITKREQWKSPLSVICERFATITHPLTEAQRIKAMGDKLQKLLIQRGGKHREWEVTIGLN